MSTEEVNHRIAHDIDRAQRVRESMARLDHMKTSTETVVEKTNGFPNQVKRRQWHPANATGDTK
jgi:hypothetical protein